MKLPGSLRLLELEEGIIGIRGKGVGAAGAEQVKSMHIHSGNIHSWKKKIFTVAIFTM